jgi:hypothetical protein
VLKVKQKRKQQQVVAYFAAFPFAATLFSVFAIVLVNLRTVFPRYVPQFVQTVWRK